MDIWEKQFEFYLTLKGIDNVIANNKEIIEQLIEINALDDTIPKDPSLFPGIIKIKNKDNWHSDGKCEPIFIEILKYLAKHATKIKKSLKKECESSTRPETIHKKALISYCQYISDLRNNIHHCICEELISKVINGDEVYAYIDDHDVISTINPNHSEYLSAFIHSSEEISHTVGYLHCSITSKEMLAYDRLMFGLLNELSDKERKNIGKFYKPYFAEFIIPFDGKGHTVGKYNGNGELKEISSENGWFTAKFITDGLEVKDESSSYVEGGLLSFASPAQHSKGKLEFKSRFKKTEKKEIYDTYSKISSYPLIDANALLNSSATDIQKATVYNIGHGNFISLQNSKNETKVVYDIGLPYTFPVKKAFTDIKNDYPHAYNTLKKINPDLVIISHWDTDHYIGAFCDNPYIFDIPWIAVKIGDEEGHINAKRIMNYLACNHLLSLIDSTAVTSAPFASYTNQDYKFELYKGSGTDPDITDINCHGIAVRIECTNIATLMCGDIPYKCLTDSIIKNNDYEYVVIPHHASNMSTDSYTALLSIASINYPIICVNGDDFLGKSSTKVRDGDHCKKIKKISKKTLCFTDDTNAPVKEYWCYLNKTNSMVEIT